MLKLVNREAIMGEYRNSLVANVIAWGTSITLILLTVFWVATIFHG
jgi:Mn2+/Fe2+ NRAMP family transporter